MSDRPVDDLQTIVQKIRAHPLVTDMELRVGLLGADINAEIGTLPFVLIAYRSAPVEGWYACQLDSEATPINQAFNVDALTAFNECVNLCLDAMHTRLFEYSQPRGSSMTVKLRGVDHGDFTIRIDARDGRYRSNLMQRMTGVASWFGWRWAGIKDFSSYNSQHALALLLMDMCIHGMTKAFITEDIGRWALAVCRIHSGLWSRA